MCIYVLNIKVLSLQKMQGRNLQKELLTEFYFEIEIYRFANCCFSFTLSYSIVSLELFEININSFKTSNYFSA